MTQSQITVEQIRAEEEAFAQKLEEIEAKLVRLLADILAARARVALTMPER